MLDIVMMIDIVMIDIVLDIVIGVMIGVMMFDVMVIDIIDMMLLSNTPR